MPSDQCEPLKRPFRTYRVQVGIHSDDRAGLIWGLREIAKQIEKGASHDFRGHEETVEYSVRMLTDETMTPERYQAELYAWRVLCQEYGLQ